ncbi:MAG TPA: hypothetical protein VFJ58_29825 [Armatimonadota bacterium]|nr:hypothetical protein [Armatimonadota bacterium]
MGDCNYDPANNPTPLLFAWDVGKADSNKTVNQAPYNLVFVNGCNSADTSPDTGNLADGFAITNTSIDQAFVGWTTEIVLNQKYDDWSHQFLSDMGAGDTVSAAMKDGSAKVQPDAVVDGDGKAVPGFIGDRSTTLHTNVYQHTGWYWTNQ